MARNHEENPAAPPLGEQELDVLQFVTDNAPTTARVAAELWGQPRGLAKSTVLTVLERLRVKGYLTRTKRYGSFEYSPAVSKSDLLRRLVREFVERTLGGSTSPLIQYLAESRGLTPAELAWLETFAQETQAHDPEITPTTSPERETRASNVSTGEAGDLRQ